MSGIDKIIQDIEFNTDKSCDAVLSTARSKAESIMMDAQRQAEQIIADGKERTALHVSDIKKRGESAADLEEKRVLLSIKQHIISQMLQNGLENAKHLPDDEYFSLILQMIGKYSLPEDGTILFGEKDLKRLPAGFASKINDAAKGKIALSDKAAAIDAGFILQYGGIEENCSFDAIFASEAENLSDRAGRLLF